MKETITIVEVFGPTIQGEGALAGAQTVFVRTGGCDYRCRWCDSLHAVMLKHKGQWAEVAPDPLLARIMALTTGRPMLVTLSGGNPAVQPLGALLTLGHKYGFTFALETQGSIAQAWFSQLDHLILSPKPPASGMRFQAARLQACLDAVATKLVSSGGVAQQNFKVQTSLKVVVLTEEDYTFARFIYDEFARPHRLPFFITPGNHTPPSRLAANHRAELGGDGEIDLAGMRRRTEWLIERCARDGFTHARIIPQLHTFLWGNAAGV